MKKFTFLKGIAAVMPDINIDTDAIIPKQFLKTIHRKGLGKNLFYNGRYTEGYNKNADFIFDMFTGVINFSAKEEKGLKSKNAVKSSNSLDKVLKFYVKKANNFIKSVTTGNNVDYGAKIKNIRKFEYIYSITNNNW